MQGSPIRILGIDPGSRITGYAVVELRASTVHFLTAGIIRLSEKSLPERLGKLLRAIEHLLETQHPTTAAIENVFMHKNAMSALKLGQARGAIIATIAAQGLSVSEYAPTRVKQALVGKGQADKQQVMHMVKLIAKIQQPLPVDASDALAVAICHAHHMLGQTRWVAAK